MENKYCDQCENQCPIAALKCGKGRRHFGMESEDDNDKHSRQKPEGTLGLLLQCGHFLHHSGISGDDLMNALHPDEQAELGQLLETLLRDWKNRVPAENHHHGHRGRGECRCINNEI